MFKTGYIKMFLRTRQKLSDAIRRHLLFCGKALGNCPGLPGLYVLGGGFGAAVSGQWRCTDAVFKVGYAEDELQKWEQASSTHR